MGTVNFTVAAYGRNAKHSGMGGVISTSERTSDAYTSSTSASFVEDGSGDITLYVGEVIRLQVDEAAWVRFGDNVATVGDGFYVPPDIIMEFECAAAGKVSIIDVA